MDTIYEVPLAYHDAEGVRQQVCRYFGICRLRRRPDLRRWDEIVSGSRSPRARCAIGGGRQILGLLDAYKSLNEGAGRTAASPTTCVNGQSTGSIPRIFEIADGAASCAESVTAFWCRAASASAAPRARSPRHPLRPRAQRALFRHLLRHADGGDRLRAQCRRPQAAPDSTEFGPAARARRSGIAHRVDRATTSSSRNAATATWAAPCGSAPMPATLGQASRGRARSTPRAVISERHRHRYEVNIKLPRKPGWSGGPGGRRPVAGRGAARRSSSCRGPSLVPRRAVPPGAQVEARSEPHPLFTVSFIDRRDEPSRRRLA